MTRLSIILWLAYPSKQEEAVRSHWSATRVASQACTPSLIRAANQGQSPWADGRRVEPEPGRSGCMWTGRFPHSEHNARVKKWIAIITEIISDVYFTKSRTGKVEDLTFATGSAEESGSPSDRFGQVSVVRGTFVIDTDLDAFHNAVGHGTTGRFTEYL